MRLGTHYDATPDQLEKAALNLAAQAQAMREFDEREPKGDEPTISFKHSYGVGSECEYTFVAFKATNFGHRRCWYLTGRETEAYTWRELGSMFRAVAEGRYWIATAWEYQGGPE